MRIAYLTDTYDPEINGIVTSIDNFTNYLAGSGHQVLILAPKYGKHRESSINNITVKRFASFSFATNRNTHIAYPALIGIVMQLRDFKPDIIHIQTPLSIGVAGVFAGKILGVPVIQTYHTYIPDFMIYVKPSKLLKIDKVTAAIANSKALKAILESDLVTGVENITEDIDKRARSVKAINKLLKRRRGRSESFTDRFAWDFTRFLYGNSSLVITPSKAMARLLKRHRLKVPVVDVSNGIDASKIPEKESYKINHRILNTGRLGVEGKNVDVVIRAFAEAKKKRPNLILDIAGDGPAAKSLKELAKSLGVSDSVNFLGFVSNKTLLGEYKKSDLFVTASTMETQGLVILEAMAAGLPVIGVDALAVPELVKNNKNGYLVPPGNIKEMAEAMLRLTEDSKLNKKIGFKSKELAAMHDLAKCAEKLERLYKTLI